MKRIIFAMIAFFALTVYAQKVDVNVDDFTGEKVVTTEWERIYSGGATGKDQTRVRFRHENGKDYMEFRIFTNSVTSVKEGSNILLKTEDGMVSLVNNEYSIAEPGAWHPSGINNKLGIYIICVGNMTDLKDKSVTKIRVNYSDGYNDIEIKKKDSQKLQILYNVFLSNK